MLLLPLPRVVPLLIPNFPQPSWAHPLLALEELGLSIPSGLKVSCAACVWERWLKGMRCGADFISGCGAWCFPVLTFVWTINETDKEAGSQHVETEKKKKPKNTQQKNLKTPQSLDYNEPLL